MYEQIENMRGRVCQALAVAALAELVLNRTLTRAGIFMPKQGMMTGIYSTIAALSQPVFMATVLLALTHTLLIIILLAHGIGSTRWRVCLRQLAAVAVCAVLISTLAMAGQPSPLWAGQVYGWLAVVALILLAVGATAGRRWLAWSIAVTGGLSVIATLTSALGQATGSMTLAAVTPTLWALGEATLILGALPLTLNVAQLSSDRRLLLVSLMAGLLYCAVYLAAPAMTATMAIWTLGLTLYLPFPLYGLALSLWCYALLAGRERAAVILLLTAGFGLSVSLHYLLLIGALYALSTHPPQTVHADTQMTAHSKEAAQCLT